MELRMLGLAVLKLDSNILIVSEISGKIDFTKGTAAKLSAKLEPPSNSDTMLFKSACQ